MKTQQTLPENYVKIAEIDLQKDKKLALLINGLAVAVAAVMLIAAARVIPFSTLFDITDGIGVYFAKLGTVLGGMIVYLVFHELVHGIFMKAYGKLKPSYGFTGLYAYAGSRAYFNKQNYIVIALAPIVILGVILAVINVLVPQSWFWVIYIIQIMNISGAAGDIYVTVKFSKMPKDILVNDTGVAMTVYTDKNEVKE